MGRPIRTPRFIDCLGSGKQTASRRHGQRAGRFVGPRGSATAHAFRKTHVAIGPVRSDIRTIVRRQVDSPGANAGQAHVGSSVSSRRLSEEPAAKTSPSEKKSQHTVTTEGRKVYSLQVELPVGQLLQSLGPRMGMEINIDKAAIAAAGKSLDTKVKLDVKEAGEDELLRAVLEPAGLTFTRKENVVDVKPKQ